MGHTKVGHFLWVRQRARKLRKLCPYYTQRECIQSAMRDAGLYY